MPKIKLLLLMTITLTQCIADADTLLANGQNFSSEDMAIREAIDTVADAVVQIRTVGGLDRVGKTELNLGPVTGLVLTKEGYVVSSAFNFAQKPSSILVRLPSGKQVPAELVARDLNRMLVLLKVSPNEELPVPTPVPQHEIAVGQWAIALGRTFQTEKVDVSLGIISAVGRMQGRAIQTDANISAANYGGPLVDIRGRVFGVLVPMSPQSSGNSSESQVAGTEFYDSGIGFAVPLEDIFSVLDQWREGDDLLPGKMGIGLKSGSPYVEPPTIVSVWPSSPASEAMWRPEDTIIAVNGIAVETQAQLQFLIKPRYAGEKIVVSLRRGAGESAEELDSEITLAGKLAPYRQAFLGILPAASASGRGVEVAGVWPKSPAAEVGILPQDRITKIGKKDTTSLSEARTALQNLVPGESIKIGVERGGDELTLQVRLATLPEQILDELPTTHPENTAEATKPKLLKLPEFSQEAYYLEPERMDSERPGLVIWLGSGKESDEQLLFNEWQEGCQQAGVLLLVARPSSTAGWQTEDLEYLEQLTRVAVAKFQPNPSQVLLAGQEKGGQMAYALAFKQRRAVTGVITDNAPLPRTLAIPENIPGGQLAVLAILPANSALAPLVNRDAGRLRQEGYPVSQLDRPEGPLSNTDVFPKVGRWIIGLNRF